MDLSITPLDMDSESLFSSSNWNLSNDHNKWMSGDQHLPLSSPKLTPGRQAALDKHFPEVHSTIRKRAVSVESEEGVAKRHS